MTILTPPKVLREKLGDDGVDALVDLVNRANEKQKEDILVFVEEKFERRLTEEIADVRIEVARSRADIIKWMFVFWAGQIGVVTGLLLLFFNLYK